VLPLRVSRDRIVAYGAAVFLAGLWQLLNNTLRDRNMADWALFWTGGATAGTRALLDPGAHLAFERAHGFAGGIWPYVPAFAALYVPASHAPLVIGYVVSAVLMLAFAAIAGTILSDVFGMPRWLGVLLALAWPPVKVAVVGGQNTPLALLLIAIAILASRRGSPAALGAAIGLLLYKPSIAAPFVIVLLARPEWRALAVTAALGACWYLLSVPAAGGDWGWPVRYAHGIGQFYTPDFLSNARNATSLPGLLMRLGASPLVAAAAGAALFLACLPRLVKLELADALSVTSVLAVATSLHAWHYEPVIMLPAIFYALRAVSQPAITWIVVAAYVVADVSIFEIPWLHWNVLIVAVLFWTALVMAVPRREGLT
jgi:Glycosyltransferase family 87